MKIGRELTFREKIRWRIKGGWSIIVCMLVYMVVVSELGGGDSRMMTQTAKTVSWLIFWGGMICVGWRIYSNYQLLKNRWLGDRWHLEEARSREMEKYEERSRYLNDKSGGFVVNVLLIVLLFTTLTAALFSMPAFYLSLSLLMVAAALKLSVYLLYSCGIVTE